MNLTARAEISRAKWLVFLEPGTYTEFFNGTNIPFNCQFIVGEEDDRGVVLYEVYRVSPSLSLSTYHYGTWTWENGLKLSNLSFYQRRNSLQGLTIDVGYNSDGSLTLMRKFSNGSSEKDGFIYSVWKTLEGRLNFTTNYSKITTTSWGILLNNNTWTGMVSAVMRNEAEVGVGAFGVTAIRSTVVDFFTPILNTRYFNMLYRKIVF
ncbi:hypothetical protein C0J52_19842 [Blattella germanica]|nr:hypothetical protein C0J52_19842 [Blattella germanica]